MECEYTAGKLRTGIDMLGTRGPLTAYAQGQLHPMYLCPNLWKVIYIFHIGLM